MPLCGRALVRRAGRWRQQGALSAGSPGRPWGRELPHSNLSAVRAGPQQHGAARVDGVAVR
eukprot:11215708-Lingulodinium_polyedra.AAC.1